MAATFQLPNGDRVSVEGDSILIGRDPECDLSLPDASTLQPQHAKIRRMAGRWLVESLGDWFVQVGDESPGRKGWLKPGDTVRLSESGPELVFEPSASAASTSTIPPAGPTSPSSASSDTPDARPVSVSPATHPVVPTDCQTLRSKQQSSSPLVRPDENLTADRIAGSTTPTPIAESVPSPPVAEHASQTTGACPDPTSMKQLSSRMGENTESSHARNEPVYRRCLIGYRLALGIAAACTFLPWKLAMPPGWTIGDCPIERSLGVSMFWGVVAFVTMIAGVAVSFIAPPRFLGAYSRFFMIGLALLASVLCFVAQLWPDTSWAPTISASGASLCLLACGVACWLALACALNGLPEARSPQLLGASLLLVGCLLPWWGFEYRTLRQVAGEFKGAVDSSDEKVRAASDYAADIERSHWSFGLASGSFGHYTCGYVSGGRVVQSFFAIGKVFGFCTLIGKGGILGALVVFVILFIPLRFVPSQLSNRNRQFIIGGIGGITLLCLVLWMLLSPGTNVGPFLRQGLQLFVLVPLTGAAIIAAWGILGGLAMGRNSHLSRIADHSGSFVNTRAVLAAVASVVLAGGLGIMVARSIIFRSDPPLASQNAESPSTADSTRVFRGGSTTAQFGGDPDFSTSLDRADAYCERASAHYRNGDVDSAIDVLNTAIRLYPNHLTAYGLRGDMFFEKDDFRRAIEEYTQVIRLDPDHGHAYVMRGCARHHEGNLENAMKDFAQAIRCDPMNVDALRFRARSYAELGQLDNALVDLDEAIRIRPDSAVLHDNRGTAFALKGAHNRAIVCFTEAIRLDPNDAKTYRNRAISHTKLGHEAEAREDFAMQARLEQQGPRYNGADDDYDELQSLSDRFRSDIRTDIDAAYQDIQRASAGPRVSPSRRPSSQTAVGGWSDPSAPSAWNDPAAAEAFIRESQALSRPADAQGKSRSQDVDGSSEGSDDAYKEGYEWGKRWGRNAVRNIMEMPAGPARQKMLDHEKRELRNFENERDRLVELYGPENKDALKRVGVCAGIREVLAASGVSLD